MTSFRRSPVSASADSGSSAPPRPLPGNCEAQSRGSVQDYNYTPSKEREGAHRDLPTSERIKNFMIDYRNSVIFLIVMSIVLAFSAVNENPTIIASRPACHTAISTL